MKAVKPAGFKCVILNTTLQVHIARMANRRFGKAKEIGRGCCVVHRLHACVFGIRLRCGQVCSVCAWALPSMVLVCLRTRRSRMASAALGAVGKRASVRSSVLHDPSKRAVTDCNIQSVQWMARKLLKHVLVEPVGRPRIIPRWQDHSQLQLLS